MSLTVISYQLSVSLFGLKYPTIRLITVHCSLFTDLIGKTNQLFRQSFLLKKKVRKLPIL